VGQCTLQDVLKMWMGYVILRGKKGGRIKVARVGAFEVRKYFTSLNVQSQLLIKLDTMERNLLNVHHKHFEIFLLYTYIGFVLIYSISHCEFYQNSLMFVVRGPFFTDYWLDCSIILDINLILCNSICVEKDSFSTYSMSLLWKLMIIRTCIYWCRKFLLTKFYQN
jgi:hypothetical protein